jgi:hypothetical protein
MTLLATLPDDPSPALANAWFHSLTMTRTVGASSPDKTLHALTQDRSDSVLARAIEHSLAGPGASVLLTDRAALEGALRHDPRLPAHRVEVLEVK